MKAYSLLLTGIIFFIASAHSSWSQVRGVSSQALEAKLSLITKEVAKVEKGDVQFNLKEDEVKRLTVPYYYLDGHFRKESLQDEVRDGEQILKALEIGKVPMGLQVGRKLLRESAVEDKALLILVVRINREVLAGLVGIDLEP